MPPDHPESNYRMAREALLDRVAPATVHRIAGELGPDEAAASYDRIVLARECSDLLDRGAWDHVLHERLAARGVRSWMDPSIVAFYTKRLTAADFLMQRYRFGRSYGAARIAAAPLARRLSLAAAPAIVVLQLWRITSLLLANRRTRRWLLPCWPLFALSAVAWSAGEAMGNAFGDGGASLEVR